MPVIPYYFALRQGHRLLVTFFFFFFLINYNPLTTFFCSHSIRRDFIMARDFSPLHFDFSLSLGGGFSLYSFHHYSSIFIPALFSFSYIIIILKIFFISFFAFIHLSSFSILALYSFYLLSFVNLLFYFFFIIHSFRIYIHSFSFSKKKGWGKSRKNRKIF